MRIDNTSGSNQAQPVDRITSGAAKPGSQPATEAGDSADVSPVADSAQGADPQRLAALRSAIESGNYRVSADELARSLVNAHLKP
jgi:anti-sigma28 factor (negative regulator of flagellin synthesis)